MAMAFSPLGMNLTQEGKYSKAGSGVRWVDFPSHPRGHMVPSLLAEDRN